jgi:hypothetical protein
MTDGEPLLKIWPPQRPYANSLNETESIWRDAHVQLRWFGNDGADGTEFSDPKD